MDAARIGLVLKLEEELVALKAKHAAELAELNARLAHARAEVVPVLQQREKNEVKFQEQPGYGPAGKLRLCQRKTSGGITQRGLRTGGLRFLRENGLEDKLDRLVELILAERRTKVTAKVERVRPRKKRRREVEAEELGGHAVG